MAGVLQIFISNKQTYRIQQNLSRLQENGRFALDYLRRYVRLTGYVDRASVTNLAWSCQQIRGNTFSASSPIITETANQMTFRFQSDGFGMSDCLGNQVNADTISTNTLSLGISSSTGEPNLSCQAGANNFDVVDGVENMRVLYGELVGNNIRYVPIASVSNVNNIQGIRISLLLRTSDNNLTQQPQPYQFDNDNNGVPETITPTDRRLRRAFTTTIALRNSCN